MAIQGQRGVTGGYRRAVARSVRPSRRRMAVQGRSGMGGITDEQRRAAFGRLEDECLYYAGIEWLCVTDEQRREVFSHLEDEWPSEAGAH